MCVCVHVRVHVRILSVASVNDVFQHVKHVLHCIKSCVAVCCSLAYVLQCVAVCCSVLQAYVLQRVAVICVFNIQCIESCVVVCYSFTYVLLL